jgi:hypothetical protein
LIVCQQSIQKLSTSVSFAIKSYFNKKCITRTSLTGLKMLKNRLVSKNTE